MGVVPVLPSSYSWHAVRYVTSATGVTCLEASREFRLCQDQYQGTSTWPGTCTQPGNLYMDSRQNLPPSVMPTPGYPHIPQALSTPGTTMAGHHGALNQQHVMPSQAFQMRRALPPDDIQDDFDWDSIV
uniref:Uncharacterized protein n=1 Tax=Sus scrofa TaxID=9823 RepID=A0A8D0MV66_PIG